MGIDDQMREQLARELCAIIDGWTMGEVVGYLGVYPARVSELRRGRVKGYTIDRLLRWAERLGYSARLILEPPAPPARQLVRPTATVERYDRFGHRVSNDSSQGGEAVL